MVFTLPIEGTADLSAAYVDSPGLPLARSVLANDVEHTAEKLRQG